MVGVGRTPEVMDMIPVDWGCSTDEGCVGTVADAGGESSHNKSFMASGTAACATCEDAADPRMDGGIRDGGRVDGMSFPANLPWIRCIATANPSRVRQPSLFRSERSL